MIGHLRGQLIEIDEQTILVDVAGVGYEVEIPIPTLAALPRTGGEVALHTHHIARDDAQQLYGFGARGEKQLFRALLRITGVGPKLALAVISSVDIADLAMAAAQNDVSRLVKVPGVGRKTAQRMLLELKDRLAEYDIAAPARADGAAAETVAEAEQALIALGYKPVEAARAVDAAAGALAADGRSTEQIVREALRRAARSERNS